MNRRARLALLPAVILVGCVGFRRSGVACRARSVEPTRCGHCWRRNAARAVRRRRALGSSKTATESLTGTRKARAGGPFSLGDVTVELADAGGVTVIRAELSAVVLVLLDERVLELGGVLDPSFVRSQRSSRSHGRRSGSRRPEADLLPEDPRTRIDDEIRPANLIGRAVNLANRPFAGLDPNRPFWGARRPAPRSGDAPGELARSVDVVTTARTYTHVAASEDESTTRPSDVRTYVRDLGRRSWRTTSTCTRGREPHRRRTGRL